MGRTKAGEQPGANNMERRIGRMLLERTGERNGVPPDAER
jgi:hypothetical protein